MESLIHESNTGETLSSKMTKISLEIKRLKNFLKIFRRNKRGMLGIGILFFFIIIGVAGPLMTPYSPTSLSRHPETPPIAFRFAKPSWYELLPLGEKTSKNVDPIPDPYFNTATSIEDLEFTSTSAGQSLTQPQFVSDVGYTKNGCAAIVFRREANESPMGEVKANLTKVFNYPYTVPPEQFLGQAAVLIRSQNITVKIDVIIEKVGSEKRLDWFTKEFSSSTSSWVTPNPLIDSFQNPAWLEQKFGPEWKINPQQKMFSEPGNYKYGVEMTFNDTKQAEKAEATVYIDDLFFKLLGTSFGLLGTDQFGRDVFTQLVYGAQVSLLVGLIAACLSTLVGLSIGLIAGYIGKFVDQILMRFTDMLLVIPDVPLFIILMAIFRGMGIANLWNLILLITVLGWTGFARVVRSQVLSLKERPFIEAAKAVGAGRIHIILRHILPNVMSLVFVSLAMAVPNAISLEAWLSFLGLYDPNVMSWGRMLYDVESDPVGIKMWWWVIPPGICIAAISLSFILLGYALDEVLNPKLRERR